MMILSDKDYFIECNENKNMLKVSKFIINFLKIENYKVDYIDLCFLFTTMIENNNFEISEKIIVYLFEKKVRCKNRVYLNFTFWKPIDFREFLLFEKENMIDKISDDDKKQYFKNFIDSKLS